jgi:hypothetical protein
VRFSKKLLFIKEFDKAKSPSQLAAIVRQADAHQERALRIYLGHDRF